MKAHKIEDSKVMFDTLQFAKRAESAGFTKEQAEFQAEELVKLIDTQLATKDDINIIRKDIETMGLKLIIRLGTIIVTTGTLIVGILIKIHS